VTLASFPGGPNNLEAVTPRLSQNQPTKTVLPSQTLPAFDQGAAQEDFVNASASVVSLDTRR